MNLMFPAKVIGTKKKLNKEQEKVLPDLIDELIAELDLTYTEANTATKSE